MYINYFLGDKIYSFVVLLTRYDNVEIFGCSLSSKMRYKDVKISAFPEWLISYTVYQIISHNHYW